jgi:hypothetical protein
MYSPDDFDWSMFIGTIGFFFTLIYPVRPIFADYFDFRGQNAFAGRAGRARTSRSAR